MITRVGINGFGRIGRAFTRLALERADFVLIGRHGGHDTGPP